MVKVYNSFYGVYKNLKNGTIKFEDAFSVISNIQKHEQDEKNTQAFIKDNKSDNSYITNFEQEMKPIIKKNETQQITGCGEGRKKGDIFRPSKKNLKSKFI